MNDMNIVFDIYWTETDMNDVNTVFDMYWTETDVNRHRRGCQ